MNLRIRRRRFGQLALASAATAAITSLASKTNAQQTSAAAAIPAGLVGAKLTPTAIIGTALSATNAVASPILPIVEDLVKIANTTLSIDFRDSNGRKTSIASTTVQNTGKIPELLKKAVSTQTTQRVTSLTSGLNGTLVTATVKKAQTIIVSQLIFTSSNSTQPDRAVTLSGFPNPNAAIESILAMQNGQYLCIFSLKSGIPPFGLGIVDPQTGVVNSSQELALPQLQSGTRYSNLTQAPDGSIYATTLSREGITRVVQLKINNKSLITGTGNIVRILDLSINNAPLENDVLSLAFSPSGILYALANPTREKTNLLYTVDTSTNKGSLKMLTTFDADKITFRPS